MANTEVTWTIGAPSGDTEIDAMRQVLVAMQPLDAQARWRVVRWAHDRFTASITEEPTGDRL